MKKSIMVSLFTLVTIVSFGQTYFGAMTGASFGLKTSEPTKYSAYSKGGFNCGGFVEFDKIGVFFLTSSEIVYGGPYVSTSNQNDIMGFYYINRKKKNFHPLLGLAVNFSEFHAPWRTDEYKNSNINPSCVFGFRTRVNDVFTFKEMTTLSKDVLTFSVGFGMVIN